MLNLEGKLKLDADAIASPNLCSRFEEEDLKRLGAWIWDGYDTDKQSRAAWERRTNAAMDLALQVLKDKNFPWPNCSNVAFPLVTIAALQFHSRAYPTLVSGTEIVKCRVVGADEGGILHDRAHRISKFMSFQKLEEDCAWEEQHDALLINLPIVGTAFKKSYYSPRLRHNVAELVLARDLVLNYWSRSVDAAPRKTHVFRLSKNDIRERVMRGIYRNVLEENWYTGSIQPPVQTTQMRQVDRRQGVTTPMPDDTTPFMGLEQHVEVDLDKDGYAEPYIITVEENSKAVLRIVTRFSSEEAIERTLKGDIISIRATEYFTKYPFIPSPDGGIYDIGFGVLLGPLNESVNSLINQLTDAGTVQNTAGGFLGRGAKIRGGVYTFKPFEWSRVDSTADDLRKSVFPLPVNEPSRVLLELLALLVNYANRIPGTVEVMVGESPGQNTPAETSRNLMEQGMKIFNAIFKRVWRAMKHEFKKDYLLNAENLPSKKRFGQGMEIMREDFLGNPEEVCPAADPNVTSEAQEIQQAIMLKQSAASTPGYNIAEVEKRFLRALRVDGQETLYPGPEKIPPSPSEKIQIKQMELQVEQGKMQMDHMHFVLELQELMRLNNAKIQQLEAQALSLVAELELKRVELQGDEADRYVALMNAQVSQLKSQAEVIKSHNEIVKAKIETFTKTIEAHNKMLEGEKKEVEIKGKEIANEDRLAKRRGVSGVASKSSNSGAA